MIRTMNRNCTPPPPPDTEPELPALAPYKSESGEWRAILATAVATVPAKAVRS